VTIYNASYPVWFFNEKEFINKFSDKYSLEHSFLSEVSSPMKLADGKNVYWKGFFLKRK
jgi:hypothetical protein